MGQGDGHGHQLWRLIAGVAEHHALVPGAVLQLGVLAGLVLQRLVHAHGNVPGLLVDVGNDAAGIAVKAVLGPVITDIADDFSGNFGDIHIALGADLAHDVDKAGGYRGLAGHTAHGILLQNGVQHRVGDLVADLIGMSFRNGLGCKQIVAHHFFFLSFSEAKEMLHRQDGAWVSRSSLIFRFTAGFGTLLTAGCRASQGRSLHRS